MRPPVPSRIIHPRTGRPAAYFFEAGSQRWQDTTALSYWNGAVDTRALLSVYTWQRALTSARFLFANVPMLRGACQEQANYAFPLERHYYGTDQDWGEEATDWLKNDYDPNCCLRGQPFDAEAVSRLRLVGSIVDGDIFTILVTDPDSGLPKIQLVRAHRVGDRSTSNGNQLPAGPFRGSRIDNGMVTDSYGRTVGFQILGDKPDQDQFASTTGDPRLPAGLILYRPTYSDQVRGITELIASVNSFDELKRLSEYEMRAQELFAAQGIIEKNETGLADETQDAIMRPSDYNGQPPPPGAMEGTATGLVTETYEAGLIRYFRSNSGSGLEAFRADRPSADAASFEARIVSRAFYGLEWDPNFALMLKEPGGAWARITLTKVNRRLSRVQAAEARVKYRTDLHALSHAVYDLGILREPKDGDIYSWGYRGPARITADSGNDATAKRNDYILGLRSMELHCHEEGRDWLVNRKQREFETVDLLTRARAVLAKFPELGNLQTAAKYIEDRNINLPAPIGGAGMTTDVTGNGTGTETENEAEPAEGGNEEPITQPAPDEDE
jgi:hypothetical protein